MLLRNLKSCAACSSICDCTYDDGLWCLLNDKPVVGQSRAKGALQGAGCVHCKLVDAWGGISDGHLHILQAAAAAAAALTVRLQATADGSTLYEA
jgi:hypothetical protein